MPKFKVTATMDVGYTAIIEADDTSEAWLIASNGDEADWEQTDNGHDWTLENIWEVDDDEVSQMANNGVSTGFYWLTNEEVEAINEKIRKWELEFHPLNETQRGFMRMHEAHHLRIEKLHAEHSKKVHEIQDIIALDWTFVDCEKGKMGEGKNDYVFDPKVDKEALKEVAGFLRNPPRNPFASETQSIKGHKSRK